jgi:hypothetical protein
MLHSLSSCNAWSCFAISFTQGRLLQLIPSSSPKHGPSRPYSDVTVCLRITIDGIEKKFILNNPVLPDYINQIRISRLKFQGEEFLLDVVKYDDLEFI